VGIGTLTPSASLEVAGNMRVSGLGSTLMVGGNILVSGATLSKSGAADTGVNLPQGGGAWSSLSDRTSKEHFATVDGRALLDRLATIPMLSWNYRSQQPSIRHLGPMAQDFHEAFALREDDRHISTVDAEGVALAASQALYQLNREKDEKIEQLTRRLEKLEARLAELERVHRPQ